MRVRVRDNIKGLWFLMVYTWCAHVQWRLRVWHQGTCIQHGGLSKSTWGRGMDIRASKYCCSTDYNVII